MSFRLSNNEVFFNSVRLGIIYREVDGYFVFVPGSNGGAWDEYALRGVAGLLQEANRSWDEEVREFFAAENASENLGPSAPDYYGD